MLLPAQLKLMLAVASYNISVKFQLEEEVYLAIRNIVLEGDPLLEKKSRPVEKVDDRILELIDDMAETMYDAEGVGIAAPQVGVLRRVICVDIGLGLHVFINPEITKQEGSSYESEGCLSLPGVYGKITRPEKITVKYLNKNGEESTLEAEGFFARAICHE